MRTPRLFAAALVAAPMMLSAQRSPTDTAITSRRATRIADSVLALMTLEEKLGQLTQAPSAYGQTGPMADAGQESQIRAGQLGSMLGIFGAEATRRAQTVAVRESRLKIPLIFGHDVIHGMRTIFPVNIGLAATWDSAAVARAARVAAVEATALGLHWTFAPMVDIARDARWGRIVEGSGEDPYLGSVMAAAAVRGFQGDNLASPTSLLATVKHFAAYGGAEAGRDYNVVSLSERDLWDVYLPPYRAAVRAGAGSVMASFNEINGTPVHANDWLLTEVLRNQWGFRGLVVSDWTGVGELIAHGLGNDTAVAKRALRAGVDLEMSDAHYRNTLAAEVRAGRFPQAIIDTAVHRLLRVKAALGLFDDPYHGASVQREQRDILTIENRAAAREIAREAIVLLTNRLVAGQPALPLRRTLKSLAVIGSLANDSAAPLGIWAAAGRPQDVVTVLAGLRKALPNLQIGYAPGVRMDTAVVQGEYHSAGIDEAAELARSADAVLLVLGEDAGMSGEAASRASIELPGAQLQLAQAVIRAARTSNFDKPVIAVVMSGRPLALQWLADSASALVASWHLGVEHGNALADILIGDYAPSGKLPATFPRATGQEPIYYNHKNTGRPADARNKYTSKYLDVPWTPLFPFGHGLSYTTFGYGNLRVTRETLSGSDSLVVAVDLTNTGTRVGTEVAQLYLRDDAATVTRPVRELKGFRRVTLQPGQTQTLRFTLRPEDLSMFDREMRRVVEPGTFTVWVGGSSDATLAGRFTVTGDVVVLGQAPPLFR
ncbi:MAG TPA: beta-glucosidase BglX [Gemmatimonadaceae bacterium]|nr:beta-glucosidase BglX [Gemmatimonadaceae bacterium]